MERNGWAHGFANKSETDRASLAGGSF